MLEGKVNVGQQFTWKLTTGGEASNAVVTRVRSNHQEGLSQEAAAYASFWIEADPASGSSSSGDAFTIMVGTDGKSYRDGKEVLIELKN